ncbi:hypothetical protein QVD17_03534 [Tagetes erecta]|uniref:Transferase, Chloramphenicol acetyltransferase-like domain protein n=1 Tax=Tagetes erecta TaxID=13708 RepID=A0AAD8LEI5_TARER|nr:hypothetical protein QVD17_03534 [Tagetes erecta]
MAMNIETQSINFIKPFIPTPSNLRHYKIGFLDELAPSMNIRVVLFFSQIDNPTFVTELQQSLAKTLTPFYPLAGRYIDEICTIDCNDEGVEFITAKVNIKLQDVLDNEANLKFVDQLIPTTMISGDATNPLLAIQVTMFKDGGMTLGVSVVHKIVDMSSLCTFITEWASMNREKNDQVEFAKPVFVSSTLFPGRCYKPVPVQPISDNDMSRKYIRKKYLFSESALLNMKANHHNWSKVQLVSAIIWKGLIDVDQANNNQRVSILLQAVNIRGRTKSLIPKNSCGNIWGFLATEAGNVETVEGLADRLTDNVKKTLNNISKVDHNTEEGKLMILDTFSLPNIEKPTNVVTLTSWCKFPFYEVDFGFGKASWVAPGCVPIVNTVCLIDEARGNGIEAHVLLEAKDVPCFEKALQDFFSCLDLSFSSV